MIPAFQVTGGVEPPTVVRAVTALVGFFVAYQAYRGYRRNDSLPMLYLGVGIAFVTTVSFVVSTLVVRPLGASDALAFLSWTFTNVVGLAAIFYAFTGATRTPDDGRGGGRATGERPAAGDRSATGDGPARTDGSGPEDGRGAGSGPEDGRGAGSGSTGGVER